MEYLGYGATDQSAAIENDRNQVSTSSENTTLEVNARRADHVSSAGGSEAPQTPKPNGRANHYTYDVYSYVAIVMLWYVLYSGKIYIAAIVFGESGWINIMAKTFGAWIHWPKDY